MAESDLIIQFEGKDVNVAKTLQTISKGLQDLEKKSTETTKKFSENMKALGAASMNVTQKMTAGLRGQVGMLMGMAGIGGLTVAIKKGIHSAHEWQQKMAGLSVMLSDDFGGSITEVDKELRKLAKTTTFTKTELATAFQMIAKSGVKGTNDLTGALKVLDAAQKLAVVTSSDLGSTVSGVSRIMQAFGMSADKASEVTDKLLIVARKGGMNFQQLSGTMGYLAATANQTGIKFDDLMSAMIGMQRAGVPARNTTLALQAVLQSALHPSKTLAMHFDNLKTGYKNLGELVKDKGLGGFFGVLKQISGGSVENLQRLIPNFRAMRGASAMVSNGMAEMQKAMGELSKSAGTTSNSFQKIMETKQFEMFQKKVSHVLSEVGDKLLPVVEKGLEELSKWFDQNRKNIVDGLTAFGEALVKFLKFMVENAGTIMKILVTVFAVEKIASFASSIKELALAFHALKIAMAAVGAEKAYALLAKAAGVLVGGAGVVGVAAVGAGIAAAGAGLYGVAQVHKQEREQAEAGQRLSNSINSKYVRMGDEEQRQKLKAMGWPTKEEMPQHGITITDGKTEYAESAFEGSSITGKPIIKKIPTADEVAKHKKDLEEAEKFYTAAKEKSALEYQKVWFKYEKEREEIEKKTALSAEQRQELDYEAQLRRDDDLYKIEMDQEKRKAEFVRGGQKALEEYHAMRMEWQDKEDKKKQEGEEYLNELATQNATERERKQYAFEEDIRKIKSMSFAGGDFDKQMAINLRTKQHAKDTGGIVASFEEMFTGKFWADVSEGFANKVGEKLLDYAMQFADFLTTPLSALTDVFTSLMGGMGNVAGAGLGKITGIFNEILGGGKGVADVKTMTQSAVEFFQQLAAQLPAAIEWFAKEGAPQIIKSFVDALPGVINAIVDAIPHIIDNLINNLDDIIMPFVEGILTLVPALIERIPDIIAAIIALIPKIVAAFIAKIPGIVSSLAVGFLKIIGNVAGLLGGFVKDLGTMLFGKGKAQKARESKENVMKRAGQMGYSAEQTAAAGEAMYNKVMGNAYDQDLLKQYQYDDAYNKRIQKGEKEMSGLKYSMQKKGASDVDIQKALDALRAKIIAEATAAGNKQLEGWAEFVKGDEGKDTSGMLFDTSLETSKGGPSAVAGKAEADARANAKRAYDKAYADYMKNVEKDWKDESIKIQRHGVTEDVVAVEKEAFYAKHGKSKKEVVDALWLAEFARLQAGGVTGEMLADEKERFYDAYKVKAQEQGDAAYDKVMSAAVYHQGGVVRSLSGIEGALKAHSGIIVPRGLSSGEVPIIAQAGEAVMNRTWVQNAGGPAAVNRMNRTGESSGAVNNVYIQHNMSNDTAQVIDGLMTDSLRAGKGRMYEKINGGKIPGFRARR